MKKQLTIIVVMAMCLLALGMTGKRYHDRWGWSTTIITKTLSAAQNNYVLLPPVTGRTYVVDKIIFSNATATYLYMNDTKTAGDVGYGYVYAPTNGSFIDDDMCLKLDAAAGLYINVGGASYLHVEYHY